MVPGGGRRAHRRRPPRSATVAQNTGATPTQVALAWLLHLSPVMLPIPGTKSVAHLEENCAAGALSLTSEQLSVLDAAHADA